MYSSVCVYVCVCVCVCVCVRERERERERYMRGGARWCNRGGEKNFFFSLVEQIPFMISKAEELEMS